MRSDIGGRAAFGKNPELQLFFGTIASTVNSFITSQATKAATDLCQPANVSQHALKATACLFVLCVLERPSDPLS